MGRERLLWSRCGGRCDFDAVVSGDQTGSGLHNLFIDDLEAKSPVADRTRGQPECDQTGRIPVVKGDQGNLCADQ
jgi:hypothetical protein